MTHNTTTQKEAGTALQVLNEAIQSSKAIKKEAGETITASVKDIISFLIEEGKKDASLSHLTDAKTRNKSIAMIYLSSGETLDNTTKDAIKVAYHIFDGYILRKEALTLSTMLKLVTLPKSEVNKLMENKYEDDYKEAVKTLLDTYKVDKLVKQFKSPAKI
jgi:hypothetical protein